MSLTKSASTEKIENLNELISELLTISKDMREETKQLKNNRTQPLPTHAKIFENLIARLPTIKQILIKWGMRFQKHPRKLVFQKTKKVIPLKN